MHSALPPARPTPAATPAARLAAPLMTALAALGVAGALLLPPPAQAATTDISDGFLTPRVVGSGKVIDERRTVGEFRRLRLDSAITVNARPAARASVTVHADDNLAPMILTEVEGDTLVVKLRPRSALRTESPLVVNVEFTALSQADLRGSGDLNLAALQAEQFEISLAGSGDVRLDNAELGRLSVRLAGSGDIWLKGRSDEASLNIAGSGDVHAAGLIARRVGVDIAGSGDVRVHATEALTVQIAGSGDVTYSGNPPRISRRVVGSGDIRPAR